MLYSAIIDSNLILGLVADCFEGSLHLLVNNELFKLLPIDYIEALPPPLPPKVEPLFQPLVSLLQCDIMVHIMHLVLQRTVAVRSRSWSEAQVDRVSSTKYIFYFHKLL